MLDENRALSKDDRGTISYSTVPRALIRTLPGNFLVHLLRRLMLNFPDAGHAEVRQLARPPTIHYTVGAAQVAMEVDGALM